LGKDFFGHYSNNSLWRDRIQVVRRFFKKNFEILLVFSLASFFAFLSVFHVFYWAFKTPVGSVYLWLGHYWEDYFTYLSQIDQGLRGKWLLENVMTGENGPLSLIGWGNLWLGWGGRLLGLSAPLAYWLGVLGFNFVSIILTYLVVRVIFDRERYLRLSAFLVFLFSSSFYWLVEKEGERTLSLLDHWYSTGPAFNRIGTIPHHSIANVLILSSVLLFYLSLKMIKRGEFGLKFWGGVILNGIFLGLNFLVKPGVVLIFCFSFGMVLIFWAGRDFLKKKKFNFYFLAPILGYLPFLLAAGVYTLNVFGKFHFLEMKKWDMAMTRVLDRPKFFLSFGPVIFLGALGIKSLLKKLEPLRVMGFLVVLMTFLFLWIPVGRWVGFLPYRVVSPAMHIFIGSMAVLGLKNLARLWVRFFKKGDWRKVFLIFVVLFLVFSLPALGLEIKAKVNNPSFGWMINFMPRGIYDGFEFLRERGSDEEVVLASGGVGVNTALPAFAAKRVFVGRTIETLDFDNKVKRLNDFFELKMTREGARDFLEGNKIKYVLVTVFDGWGKEEDFKEKYGLYDKIFENNMVTILEVN
jgi:hypothetical protein